MKSTLSFLVLTAIVILLPGCTRIVDWVKDSCYQGCNTCYDKSVPQHYIRSTTVYDEFDTKGRFDILWLSDHVKTAYAHVHALKQGKTDAEARSFLRRQLAENDHFITFYVLVPPSYILGYPTSEWALFLQVGDVRIQPIEIREIEIEPEYKAFLGKHFNRFRASYRVRFPAKDNEGIPLLHESIQAFTLHARSFSKNLLFVWDVERE